MNDNILDVSSKIKNKRIKEKETKIVNEVLAISDNTIEIVQIIVDKLLECKILNEETDSDEKRDEAENLKALVYSLIYSFSLKYYPEKLDTPYNDFFDTINVIYSLGRTHGILEVISEEE